MSAQDFIEYYTNDAKSQLIFHFKRFIQKNCLHWTFEPIQLETHLPINLPKAKDLLIKNLCLNEFFYSKDIYFTDDFSNLYNLLIRKKNSDKNLAQITLLILISKQKLDFYFFESVLQDIERFELIDSAPFDHLVKIFNKLKQNEVITAQILNISKKILNLKEINFVFEDLEILFFNYPDHKLHGFAGIDRIYVAHRPLFELKKKLTTNRSKANVELVLELEFMRLFIHLSIHVILICAKNDLNFPHARSHDFMPNWSIDSGFYAENNFFEFQINWFEYEDIDLDLWRIFFEHLIDQQRIVKFNVLKSGVKCKKDFVSINGVDYFSFD